MAQGPANSLWLKPINLLTQPSKNDWFGGWAKRMGELQCQAYEKQYGEGKCSIVRPGKVSIGLL